MESRVWKYIQVVEVIQQKIMIRIWILGINLICAHSNDSHGTFSVHLLRLKNFRNQSNSSSSTLARYLRHASLGPLSGISFPLTILVLNIKCIVDRQQQSIRFLLERIMRWELSLIH